MNVTPNTTLAEMYVDLTEAAPDFKASLNDDATKVATMALYAAGAVAALWILKEGAEQGLDKGSETFNRLFDEAEKFVKEGIKFMHEKNNPDIEPKNRMS